MLHERLEEADCVVLATPFARQGHAWLGPEELRRMRSGSLLMILAGQSRMDLSALQKMVDTQRLCGLVVDGRACIPESVEEQFQGFLRNLRSYVAGDSDRMEGRVSSETG
jgi:lactate dehydrogenase-like 2-hydroxyacid dehydrogenase